ncbi:hypothetical protein MGSAQ_000480 [marine sediment metagenome]|uniref:Uncharacterized protein n=1 Tax=marine sediment metagenome TaxID=412755 RepID=A0A1B6NX90_9ZZZZ
MFKSKVILRFRGLNLSLSDRRWARLHLITIVALVGL